MTRPGGIFIGVALLVLAALGVTAWVIRREPPPPPPHEFDKLISKVMADPAWHERFIKSLPPEQRRKMGDRISQEQQLQMVLQMVDALQKMPAPLRKEMMILGRERMKQVGQPGLTKERMAERIGSTTPTQRAKFVRAMRDLRAMAQQAGIRD